MKSGDLALFKRFWKHKASSLEEHFAYASFFLFPYFYPSSTLHKLDKEGLSHDEDFRKERAVTMRKPVGKRFFISLCTVILLMIAINLRPIDQYISVLKQEAIEVDKQVESDDELRRQIEGWKKEREQAPVNPYVDTVWKSAVPGYNGLVVDVEASIARMKQSGKLAPEQLVYKQVAPSIALEKLGSLPIYRGNPQKPAISLMINVAWGNEHLDPILDTLDKYGVKTTFFLDGSWVKRHPELAKEIAKRGHEIGNHAYSHPDMKHLNGYMIRQEIGKTQEIIKKTVGITPTLFAPPSGSFSQAVVTIAHDDFSMKTILWTADTVDWQEPSLDTVMQRVYKKMGNGVLVLMHPTNVSKNGLAQLIQLAKKRGLQPTTVSEVISSQRLEKP